MTLIRAGLKSYDIIMEGAKFTARFQLNMFLNLEERTNGNDEAEVILKIKPAAVNFITNKSISAWQRISSFPETHVTQGPG